MSDRKPYKPTSKEQWARVGQFIWKFASKLVVPVAAIWGRYPKWMVTPDDPVSPFGSGTTKGASREQTQVDLYSRFGRWVGDVVWLAWRNGGYWFAYQTKPDWLKRPGLRYMDLELIDERSPPADGYLDAVGNFVEQAPGEGTLWVRCPDGSWLWETTRRFGPVFVITGYRLSAIAMGAIEDWRRIAKGLRPVPRPLYHPNMDGRRLFTMRTARTM